MSCPTPALDPHTLAPALRPPAPGPDPAREALAAIASTYEDARAGIISGEPSPAVVPAGYSPTVPLTLPSDREPAHPARNPGAPRTVTTWWSRLLRRPEPGRRGRHCRTVPGGLPPESFAWGPPGRVRHLS